MHTLDFVQRATGTRLGGRDFPATTICHFGLAENFTWILQPPTDDLAAESVDGQIGFVWQGAAPDAITSPPADSNCSLNRARTLSAVRNRFRSMCNLDPGEENPFRPPQRRTIP
jgi:hypothetical protein